jgi:hypothetical protein
MIEQSLPSCSIAVKDVVDNSLIMCYFLGNKLFKEREQKATAK